MTLPELMDEFDPEETEPEQELEDERMEMGWAMLEAAYL